MRAISSCIRNPVLVEGIGTFERLERNPTPNEGDVVLVKIISDEGSWDSIEDISGAYIPLASGDLIASVLGTRQSGTNPSGFLPQGHIRRGDLMSILSISGLIGVGESFPRYYRPFRQVQVEDFFATPDGPLNLRHLTPALPSFVGATPPVVLVTGTSAEVGKTTAAVRLIRCMTEMFPGISIGAIKACGTGRLKDCNGYREAGATRVFDFVDCGWPSTYNIPPETYRQVLRRLLSAVVGCDIVFVEIGGDLLEGLASDALQELCTHRATPVFCVNDAMGALTGLRMFAQYGWDDVIVCSHRQNLASLRKRIGMRWVLDTADSLEIAALALSLHERLL